MLLLLGASGAHAQTTDVKANNTTNLSANGSWVSGLTPNSSVIAIFNGTLDGTVSGANIGSGGISVLGLQITNTGASFSINKSSSNALTIGASGIDMSSVSNGNNDFTINAPVVLTAAQTWDVATARTLNVANTIDITGNLLTLAGAGTFNLTKVISGTGGSMLVTGGGTAILAAANTFDSGLTVESGTAEASNNAAFGTGAITLGDASTGAGGDISLLAATGGRTIANDISVANDGNSTTIGGLNSSGTSTFSGNITLAKDLDLTTAAGGTVRLTGVINGTGNVTLNGGGTLNLDGGANAYTGNLNIDGGTLSYSVDNALPDTGGVVINGGSLSLVTHNDTVGDVLLIDGTINGSSGVLTGNSFELQNGTVTADLGGTGNILKTTSGTVILGANNTAETGNLVVRDGTVLAQGNNNALGAGNVILGDALTQNTDSLALLAGTSARTFSNNITVNNYGQSITLGGNFTSGTSTFSGAVALGGNLDLSSLSGGTLNLTGQFSGAGNLTILGGGTVIINNTSNDASMTGAVNITAGTLSVAGGGAIGDNSAVTVQNGANLAVTASETVGSLAGAGNVTLSNKDVLTAGNNNQSTTFSGIIQGGNGNSGLTKSGTGTLTLTNANTYTGSSTISGGTLQLGDGATIGSVAGAIVDNANLAFDNPSAQTFGNVISGTGSVSLIGTGTLTLNNTNTYTGNTTISSGTLQLGDGATNGVVAGAIVDNANLAFDNPSAQTVNNLISGGGNLAVSGSGNVTLTAQNSFTGHVAVNSGVLALNDSSGPALGNASSIMITTGGTLLLDASNQINPSATMTLAGGTFNTNGLSEGTAGSAGLGALTLTANSTLNLGSGASTVAFANSSGATWSGGTLYIDNWNGNLAGGGADQIYFGTDASGLTLAQLTDVVFVNPAGFAPGTWGGILLPTGELVAAAPEPGTWAAGGVLTLLAVMFEWRRRKHLASTPS